jgi:hypothetical protein
MFFPFSTMFETTSISGWPGRQKSARGWGSRSPRRQLDVPLGRQVLAPEKHHLVLVPRIDDLGESSIVDLPGEIDVENFGAQRRACLMQRQHQILRCENLRLATKAKNAILCSSQHERSLR